MKDNESRLILARLEEVILNSVYERVAARRDRDHSSDPIHVAFDDGFDHCLETLWSVIEEHNGVNESRLQR